MLGTELQKVGEFKNENSVENLAEKSELNLDQAA
jgi:hypothetical protein